MRSSVKVARQLSLCDFRGWPSLRLQQGELILHVVPQIGGRLMGIRIGDDELCFVHPDLAGKAPSDDGTNWQALCGDWDFPLWGGGKTWIAPESHWPGGVPHPDLDSGPYTINRTWMDARSMGVELESAICRLSDLQIQRRFELFRGARGWRVTSMVTNRGSEECQCGVWDVLMLNRPATALVSLSPPSNETSPDIDRRDSVRPMAGKGPLADLYDAGVLRVDRDVLRVVCKEPVEFKVGALSETGEIRVRFAATRSPLLYRRRSQSEIGARFAHGHPVEIFNAPVLPYFEVESHSALVNLSPGESVSLVVDETLARDQSCADEDV